MSEALDLSVNAAPTVSANVPTGPSAQIPQTSRVDSLDSSPPVSTLIPIPCGSDFLQKCASAFSNLPHSQLSLQSPQPNHPSVNILAQSQLSQTPNCKFFFFKGRNLSLLMAVKKFSRIGVRGCWRVISLAFKWEPLFDKSITQNNTLSHNAGACGPSKIWVEGEGVRLSRELGDWRNADIESLLICPICLFTSGLSASNWVADKMKSTENACKLCKWNKGVI